jgi:uncharacterized protein
MDDVPFIARGRVLPADQDYAALRELGMERIRALSTGLWTDHNSHDPGITIIEALAYAITDLGYRTGFSTADLLTRPDGLIGPASETGLFPAHEALTCSPITIADHRQVLLRIADVHNAWLDPMQDPAEPDNYRLSEVPIYADCAHDRLTYDEVVNGSATHPVKLSGLYKVLVELERDDLLGSLNETALGYTIKSGPLKGVRVALDSDDAAFLAGAIDFAPAFAGIAGTPTATGEGLAFEAAATLDLDGGTTVTFSQLRIAVTEDRPRPTADPVIVTAADLVGELSRDDADAILRRFWEKQHRRQAALARVRCVLNAHRPLCEDWLSVATVAPFRVGVCADVDLAPEADLERVQAEIFHAIEQYLSPPVRWRSLESLLEEGVSADEIFNGPAIDYSFECGGGAVFTKPGFLTREDLEACALRRSVHSSDIINLVVDIPGVLGVRGLTLRAYDAAGNTLGGTEEWTLAVPPDHQPVLFFEGTKVLLFKNELQYRAQEIEFLRTLEHLRALARAALYVPPGQVLPAVVGRWRSPDAAYPVQHDLPRLYGTGPAGLAPEEPAERFAKARQLKGYLAHFDWLLADYLGQLAGVRRLLSPDPVLAQSYFPQLVTEVAGTLEAYEDEFYLDKTRLADTLYRARLTESEETFLDRRGRALDHLLARFAERFADYALMSFRLAGDSLGTARELIEDKAAFLAEAPVLSRERSLGFDYRPEDAAEVWDTDNVPGLQKRVARLLGIADYTRRDLHCSALFAALVETMSSAGSFRLRIRAEDGTPLFISDETFATSAAARDAARPIFARLRRAETYVIDDSGGIGAVRLRLEDGAGAVLIHRDAFETTGDAARRAREIVLRYDALLQSPLCDNEGLHVIEHILLRPRGDGDPLLQVCLPKDCAFCGEQDPYSFRLHVVLPYWPERFQDLAFRRYAERLIREETPAHIMPRICWVGNEEMRDLDRTWHAWLDLTADPGADPAALSDALGDLIAILERLRTVYPPASLHDCQEGDDENIVRLGATTLGLF